uniref:Uncharacterized protein n=1 Tax=viral metagenome TaxID=1070528 RepID=A0A6C0LXS4_9ZZZZ
MFRRLFLGKKSNPIILGRWGRGSEFQESVKSTWTNSDHCGDIICGKPKNVKDIINNELTIEKLNKKLNKKNNSELK